MNKHEGHEVGTANNVTFDVGYNEDNELVQTPQTSRIVLYCYTCDEPLTDYEALLKKYIKFVGDAEGTDFIGSYYKQFGDFTDEEWTLLEEISEPNWKSRTRTWVE